MDLIDAWLSEQIQIVLPFLLAPIIASLENRVVTFQAKAEVVLDPSVNQTSPCFDLWRTFKKYQNPIEKVQKAVLETPKEIYAQTCSWCYNFLLHSETNFSWRPVLSSIQIGKLVVVQKLIIRIYI